MSEKLIGKLKQVIVSDGEFTGKHWVIECDGKDYSMYFSDRWNLRHSLREGACVAFEPMPDGPKGANRNSWVRLKSVELL